MRAVRRLLSGLAGLAALAVLAGVILAWLHGYRMYIVHTGSMIPTFRPGEALVDSPVRGPVHRGEIITFRYAYGPDQVVSHRVFSDAHGIIHTKGDANPTKDPWTLRRSQVVGTPIAIVPYGGYALYYLSQPAGAASVVLFGTTTWLLWGLCFPPDEQEGTDEAGPRRRPGGRHATLARPGTHAAPGTSDGCEDPGHLEWPDSRGPLRQPVPPLRPAAGDGPPQALAATDVLPAIE